MSIPTIISTPSVQKNLEQNNDDNNNNNEILSPSTSNNTTNTNNNNIILPPSSIQAPIAAIPTIISSSASTTATTTKTNIAIPISISSSNTTTSSNTTASAQQQSQQQSGTICPKCGSTNIDRDDASGNAVCMACGTVIEENTIVSSVQFAESSGGSSSIVGQYVAATATKSFTSGMSNRGITYSKESREITINNGRKRIAQLAAKLRLGQHYVDSAHRLFLLAVQRNFVQGRRTAHVVAACLYIVCRTEKSPYLLIDFSDALQVNVYELGTCFLKFCRLLNLSLPLIEPTLYIHRFSSKLEFGGGEKTHQVAMTALRLVKRFKKDWIQTGRRPAGICAAALFLASGMHGFKRTQKDIISVTRICDQTLRNRLSEFSQTPTALLTPEEFETIDLPEECDPPSFTRNRMLEAKNRQLLLSNVESGTLLSLAVAGIGGSGNGGNRRAALTSGASSSGGGGSNNTTTATTAALPISSNIPDDILTNSRIKRSNRIHLEREREFNEFYTEMSTEMQIWEREHGETLDKDDDNGNGYNNSSNMASGTNNNNINATTVNTNNNNINVNNPIIINSSTIAAAVPVPSNLTLVSSPNNGITSGNNNNNNNNNNNTNALNDNIYGYDSEDDDDLDSYVCNSIEVKQKTEVWNRINKSYLEEQAQKKLISSSNNNSSSTTNSNTNQVGNNILSSGGGGGGSGSSNNTTITNTNSKQNNKNTTGRKRKNNNNNSSNRGNNQTNKRNRMKKGKDGKGGHDKKDHGGGGGGKKPISYSSAADAAYHTMDRKKTKKIDYEAMQSLFQQDDIPSSTSNNTSSSSSSGLNDTANGGGGGDKSSRRTRGGGRRRSTDL